MRSLMIGLSLLLAACSYETPTSGPSAAIQAMRQDFETRVLAAEKGHSDAEDIRHAATGIALEVYGKDWNVVRAEAKRSLAALPALDLAPYETAPSSQSARPAEDVKSSMNEATEYLTPAGMAMMRFWDAQAVGGTLAPMFVNLSASGDPMALIGVKMSLVPPRTFRGKFKGADVLASRYMRSLVIAPYSMTAEGMILPDFEKVGVFDLKP
ncbi:MAG TPA: hypothetical protein VG942_01005 [Hyphomonadaceae bacterium]|nr:hypothetical protein [Hyphomonadaceae bacterium]